MIVAVTGINSGLGGALVPKLQKEPTVEKIIGIDISEYQGNPEKVEIHKLDVRDQEGMERALKGVDVLIHLAFIVAPKKLPKLKIIYDINVNGSKTVFDAAAKNKVGKIIYTSSQSVYGHIKECPKIVTEESARLGIKTTNFYYSHTKALVEEYLDEIQKTNPDIAIVRFRPPVITGAHFLQNLDLINPKSTFTTIKPENPDNPMSIQLIHEDDLTGAIMIAVKRHLSSEAFNVASNIIPDLEKFLTENFNVKVRRLPRFIAKIGIRLGRIWTKLRWLQAILYSSSLSTEKIERELNWKPKYSTEDCLRQLNQSNKE